MVKKHVVVKLIGEAKDAYLTLQRKVREEEDNGIKRSLNQTLLRAINSKIAILKTNYDYGDHVPRDLIPKKYSAQYDVTNLWRVDLSDYWRMIYTLKQPYRDEVEIDIVTVWLDVLDIIDHPTYDRIFGYRKK